MQAVADYGAFVGAADRGQISEKKEQATQALLNLQEISKAEDFQRNPKEYLGLSKIEEFKRVSDDQADTESSYYVAGASGWVNSFDHDKFIEGAVEAVERTITVMRGGRAAASLAALTEDAASRGETIASQVLSKAKASESKGGEGHSR